MDKICKTCLLDKDEAEFYKHNSNICINCVLQRQKGYYKTHKPKIINNRKIYYSNNKNVIVARHKIYKKHNSDKVAHWSKNYRIKHRDHISTQKNLYYKSNIQARLAKNLRRRLNHSIKSSRAGSAVRDLGCSIEQLKRHLESKFQPGMSWNNYGQWHIDHIKPLSRFNLTRRDQILQSCHFSNLQPLWKLDNIVKHNH